MICFRLTKKEIQRVKRAARFAGIPWQPICSRPETARSFYRRVEAEMRRCGDSQPGMANRSPRPFTRFSLDSAWSTYGRLLSERG